MGDPMTWPNSGCLFPRLNAAPSRHTGRHHHQSESAQPTFLFRSLFQVWRHNYGLHETNIPIFLFIFICIYRRLCIVQIMYCIYKMKANICKYHDHASSCINMSYHMHFKHLQNFKPTSHFSLNLRRGELQQRAHVGGWRASIAWQKGETYLLRMQKSPFFLVECRVAHQKCVTFQQKLSPWTICQSGNQSSRSPLVQASHFGVTECLGHSQMILSSLLDA